MWGHERTARASPPAPASRGRPCQLVLAADVALSSFLGGSLAAAPPTPKQLGQWLAACQEICTLGIAQTQDLARKQIRLRDTQVATLLLQQPPAAAAAAPTAAAASPSVTEAQQRIDDLRNERHAWQSFATAHVDFLEKGRQLIAAAPRRDHPPSVGASTSPPEGDLEFAFQNVCAGVVYVKNVFIFTFSMRSKTRAHILKQCRASIQTADDFLHALAPKLTVRQIQQQFILYWALRASAFDLVPQIYRRQYADVSPSLAAEPALDLNQLDDVCDVYAGELHRLSAIPAHLLDYRSLLDFIPLGLDPTLTVLLAPAAAKSPPPGAPPVASEVSSADTDGPASMRVVHRSAIELARQYERRWHAACEAEEEPSAADQLTRRNVTRLLATPIASPNVLQTFVNWPAREHRETDYFQAASAEDRRRKELHFAFLLDLGARWRTHSTEVRRLLKAAAPSRLIPDLANLVADYLDLAEDKPKQKKRPAAERLKLPRAIQLQ